MLKIADQETGTEEVSTLDELARQGTQKMLAAALEAEVAQYIETHQQRDEH